MLKLAGINKVVAEQLAEIKFGSQTISDDKNAEGNKGVIWNSGQNFGGSAANALTHGWKNGADSLDRYATGVGMFGKWGTKEDFMPSADRQDDVCQDDETWVDRYEDDCAEYVANPRWCAKAAAYGVDGVDALTMCPCACASEALVKCKCKA
jgi:hypothetical protein